MRKIIKKIVIAGIFLLCACVFPISLVRKSESVDPVMGEDFEHTDYTVQELKQVFVAQTGYLEEIAFDVGIPGERIGGVYAYEWRMKKSRRLFWKNGFLFRI